MGYGALQLTGDGVWGGPDDLSAARRVLRRALELGINFIDTADAYGPETNERLIADALYPYPEGLVIATKGGCLRPGPYRWDRDGGRTHLRKACEASLRRLRLERIGVYQLHSVDSKVPFEESVGALAELRAEGKIRHVGLCNVGVDHLRKAVKITPIASVQNRYNLLERESEDVLRWCERSGVAFIPWFPIGSGVLVRRRGAVRKVADRLNATAAQIALAWLLRHSPAALPIPGTSSAEHLEENVAAAALQMSEQDHAALAALVVSRPRRQSFYRKPLPANKDARPRAHAGPDR